MKRRLIALFLLAACSNSMAQDGLTEKIDGRIEPARVPMSDIVSHLGNEELTAQKRRIEREAKQAFCESFDPSAPDFDYIAVGHALNDLQARIDDEVAVAFATTLENMAPIDRAVVDEKAKSVRESIVVVRTDAVAVFELTKGIGVAEDMVRFCKKLNAKTSATLQSPETRLTSARMASRAGSPSKCQAWEERPK